MLFSYNLKLFETPNNVFICNLVKNEVEYIDIFSTYKTSYNETHRIEISAQVSDKTAVGVKWQTSSHSGHFYPTRRYLLTNDSLLNEIVKQIAVFVIMVRQKIISLFKLRSKHVELETEAHVMI